MNLILITVDALREDRFDDMVEGNPLLEEILERSFYTEMISNSCWTPPSFNSLLTSTYPLEDGGYEKLSGETLQKRLGKNGYKTALLHSTPYFSERFGYRDFDTNRDLRGKTQKTIKSKVKELTGRTGKIYGLLEELYKFLVRSKDNVAYARASEVTREGLSWLTKNSNEDKFLWMHYMDCHYPYHPPEDLVDVDSDISKLNQIYFEKTKGKNVPVEGSIEEIRELYKGEVKYTGRWIEHFLQKLKEKSELEETRIIITADHGEEFLEHGDVSHKPKLYDELIKVPLLVFHPEKSMEMEEPVETRDIMPVLLDLGNVNKDKIHTEDEGSDFVFSEVANKHDKLEVDMEELQVSCRSNRFKYIWKKDGKNEFYDLRNDPDEKENIEDHGKREEFKNRIKEHISKYKDIDFERTDKDKEMRKRLEKLGYTDR